MTTSQLETPEIAIRRRKLREWIDSRFGGSQIRFIDDCAKRGHDINQGELSALLKTKSFGEKKARSMEAIANMPAHYLNPRMGVHDQPPLLIREAEPAQAYLWPFKTPTAWEYNNVLTAGDREAVESTAKALLKARSSPIKQIKPATNVPATKSTT